MSKKYHIDIITNKKDFKSAFMLSLNSFYPESLPEKAIKIWENKWFHEPHIHLSNVYLMRSKHKHILGGLRTVRRKIFRNEQEFKVVGIAETFVNSKFQGQGIAKALTESVCDKNKEGDADLLFIVSRKNIDYFYLKHQGYGLGSYSKVLIKNIKDDDKKYIICETKKRNLEVLMNIYNYSYENCFGRIERKSKYWNFLLDSMSLRNLKLYNLMDENYIVGYFALAGNEIVEIGALPNYDYRQIIVDIYNQFSDLFENQFLSLNIPKNHKLFSNDLFFDITISNRECYYGGHIIKIINMKNVSSMAEKRLKKEYSKLNISSLEFNVDELIINWDGKKVKIDFPENHEPSYQETTFLLGSQQVYANTNQFANIGCLPFSISRLDEF
ncbi:hypothetical protein ACFLSY_01015 [Bacteroidota bacterium]